MTITEIPAGSSLELLPTGTDNRADAMSCDAPIISHEDAGDRYRRMVLHAPQIARTTLPGQFVMMTAVRPDASWPVLPRPMAVFDTNTTTGEITIVYGVVGAGTKHMAGFVAGETVVVVGPVGRPFDLASECGLTVLLGRGIGSCSLTMLAAAARAAGSRVVAVASGRTAGATIGTEFYRSCGAEVLAVRDTDASSDPAAVRAALHDMLGGTEPALIAVCGSRRLAALAADLASDSGAHVQVSLEAHMACGLGYCHGCSTGEQTAAPEAPLVCRDGPVFRLVNHQAAAARHG